MSSTTTILADTFELSSLNRGSQISISNRHTSVYDGGGARPKVNELPNLQAQNPDTANNLNEELSTFQTAVIISTLAGITFTSSMSTGLFTIGISVVSADLQLADNLLLWPASVMGLSSGCTLLLAGSIADILGNRIMNLCGGFLLGLCILASGLSRTGIEFIIFRAIQGIAISMSFPTAFSILTDAFPGGRRRNIAFAFLGLMQPFGWAIGLVLGGLFESGPLAWRFGFYLCAGLTIIFSVVNCWKLPKDRARCPISWDSLRTGIDWVGVVLSSTSLGLFSYVLAVLTGELSSIRDASIIACLCVSVLLAPAFIFWMRHQERLGRPALIPNSIWKNAAFTSICLMVLLSWGVMNSMELFLSLFFQQVQQLSDVETSLRFIPNVFVAVLLNFCTGLVVHRFKANHMIVLSTMICIISPLLMVFIHPDWSFWYCAFWVMILHPLSADVIFTVANLIITDVFPPNTQALAGAVFNTVAQFGTSIGIAVTAIISASVIDTSSNPEKSSPEALMQGYRAVFWACLAVLILSCGIGTIGLRKVGHVGMKRD